MVIDPMSVIIGTLCLWHSIHYFAFILMWLMLCVCYFVCQMSIVVMLCLAKSIVDPGRLPDVNSRLFVRCQ